MSVHRSSWRRVKVQVEEGLGCEQGLAEHEYAKESVFQDPGEREVGFSET